ncbi:hypothetical protein [Puniceibacterium confluentis]|uniref:hypothetical protein n=1 Tax=Puniceibacterium confluentis TaxID=1958944 RepID=UPI003562B1CB
MKQTDFDLRSLAVRAAQAAGFTESQAELFGRAAVRHVTQGRDCASLLEALHNPTDSPILRLPLVLEDTLSACRVLGGSAELTLNPADTELVQSYVELLPGPISSCKVTIRNGLPRLQVTTSVTQAASPERPQEVAVPETLLEQLRTLAAPPKPRPSFAERAGQVAQKANASQEPAR